MVGFLCAPMSNHFAKIHSTSRRKKHQDTKTQRSKFFLATLSLCVLGVQKMRQMFFSIFY